MELFYLTGHIEGSAPRVGRFTMQDGTVRIGRSIYDRPMTRRMRR